jgi:hypothetical protein
MKKLVPVLILLTLALSTGVAGAELPGPNAGWLYLECEGELSGNVWFGSFSSQAFHLAGGPILHPRAGWVCLTEEPCSDAEWRPWFSTPGMAKGVDTIVCYGHADWIPPVVKHIKMEVDVSPSD